MVAVSIGEVSMATNVVSRFAATVLRTRWLVRAPIWLFQHGAGFLFAGRLILLEHVGRTSGRPRYVVLEVVARPARDEIIVASGFGEQAQWYRNLRAHPHAHVSVGFLRRVPARSIMLSPEESGAILRGYARHHSRTWAQLEGAMSAATGQARPTIPLVVLELGRS